MAKEQHRIFSKYGVLHGLPDLSRWGEIIAHYLKPGGIFCIVEDHPFFCVFRAKPEGEFKAERSYFFSETPQRIEATRSYATENQGSSGVSYVWDPTPEHRKLIMAGKEDLCQRYFMNSQFITRR